MAWTSKSDRFGGGSAPAASAAAHIGPGHYKLVKSLNVSTEHGYAPFGSTDPKSAASKDARDGHGGCGAPPGAYDPKLPEKFDSGLPRKSVPFGVSATRIDMGAKTKLDFRPGPGTYKVDPDGPRLQESRTMGIIPSNQPMLRSSSAPSIPQNHQSYGYEEVGGGRLVRQGPKGALFCTGRPGDSAGPGQYEPRDDSIKPRQVQGAFMKGPARVPLDGNAARLAPGPGHYAAKSSMEAHGNSYLGGASFVSTAERGPSKRQEKLSAQGPGPGDYVPFRQKRPELRELRQELQYFGSTVERFKSGPGEGTSVPAHVGPGQYTQIKRRPEPPNARGFCSTQDRFQGDQFRETSAKPGPGAYETSGITDDTMGGPLATFSMLGNSGGLAFAAMSKRFNYPSDDDRPFYKVPGLSDDVAPEETPQPAEDPRSRSRTKRRSYKLPGAAFASKTPKDQSTKSLVKEGLQKPPPGAYDPVLVKDQATVVRLRSKSEGFLSGGDRFQGGALAPPKGYHMDVGPGKYSPQDITGGKRVGTFNRSICEGMPESGRPKGLGFESQDKRFRGASVGLRTTAPGPGQYNTDPKWISKSHNCYFGDLM